jgi:hypothetical protein
MKDWSQRIEQIQLLGKVYGWVQIQHDENSNMLGFTRKGKRVNVWYSKMTVGTSLDHPFKGKTQLFRQNVSMKLMEFIFNNPRVHTDKGYYTKTQRDRL